jgi:hypothetical protein
MPNIISLKKIIALAITSVLTIASHANQYVGLNICVDNEQSVKRIITEAGGTADSYPIAASRYKIETTFYDGKLLSVEVHKPENLSTLLKEKYGQPTQNKLRDGGYEFFFDEYIDKNNFNIKILDTWAVYRSSVVAVSLVYTCKNLNEKKLADEKKIKDEDFKLKNTGKQI